MYFIVKMELFIPVNGQISKVLKVIDAEACTTAPASESVVAFVEEDQPLVSGSAYQSHRPTLEKLKQFNVAQDAN